MILGRISRLVRRTTRPAPGPTARRRAPGGRPVSGRSIGGTVARLLRGRRLP
ncbi:hypothetical protein ACPYO6_08860 [Georgenia sp. Z1344]|uniref:hypothetical protein n=1 Tax=Georgenia sp. Z1344 TaxID=3416706 RepID=UPI003CF24738